MLDQNTQFLFVTALIFITLSFILAWGFFKLIYKNAELAKVNWDRNCRIMKYENERDQYEDDKEKAFEAGFNAGIEHIRVGDDTYTVNEEEHKILRTYIEV